MLFVPPSIPFMVPEAEAETVGNSIWSLRFCANGDGPGCSTVMTGGDGNNGPHIPLTRGYTFEYPGDGSGHIQIINNVDGGCTGTVQVSVKDIPTGIQARQSTSPAGADWHSGQTPETPYSSCGSAGGGSGNFLHLKIADDAPLGTFTMSIEAIQYHESGGSSGHTIQITGEVVEDSTPPVVNVPSDLNLIADSSDGWTVCGSASQCISSGELDWLSPVTAYDAVTNSTGSHTQPLGATCTVSQGLYQGELHAPMWLGQSPTLNEFDEAWHVWNPGHRVIPLGSHTVTCTAIDYAGNSGTSSFDVTVVEPDTTFPAETPPIIGSASYLTQTNQQAHQYSGNTPAVYVTFNEDVPTMGSLVNIVSLFPNAQSGVSLYSVNVPYTMTYPGGTEEGTLTSINTSNLYDMVLSYYPPVAGHYVFQTDLISTSFDVYDTTPPVLTVTTVPGASYWGQPISTTGTSYEPHGYYQGEPLGSITRTALNSTGYSFGWATVVTGPSGFSMDYQSGNFVGDLDVPSCTVNGNSVSNSDTYPDGVQTNNDHPHWYTNHLFPVNGTNGHIVQCSVTNNALSEHHDHHTTGTSFTVTILAPPVTGTVIPTITASAYLNATSPTGRTLNVEAGSWNADASQELAIWYEILPDGTSIECGDSGGSNIMWGITLWLDSYSGAGWPTCIFWLTSNASSLSNEWYDGSNGNLDGWQIPIPEDWEAGTYTIKMDRSLSLEQSDVSEDELVDQYNTTVTIPELQSLTDIIPTVTATAYLNGTSPTGRTLNVEAGSWFEELGLSNDVASDREYGAKYKLTRGGSDAESADWIEINIGHNYGGGNLVIERWQIPIPEDWEAGTYTLTMDKNTWPTSDVNNFGINFVDQYSTTVIIPAHPADAAAEIVIPGWIKNNAGWWASNQIDDRSFVSGLQWLITNGIMNIPPTEQGAGSDDVIPSWIKNNAGWWADELIDDRAFVTGLQWLITNGIMIIG